MKIRIILTALLIILVATGGALADIGVPQVEETQGFETSTLMQLIGTATETDSITTTIDNGYTAYWPPAPPLGGYSFIYSSAYSEHTIADQGLVSIARTVAYDTAGMAAENQYNLVTDTLAEFIGSETGRMVSGESLLLDGAGAGTNANLTLICPFATESGDDVVAPLCNIVEEGSSVDITLGSLSSQSAERFIMLAVPEPSFYGMAWPYPVADPGVEADYSVKLTGFGDVAAVGSASAYMNAHVQEGRTFLQRGTGNLYEDYQYPKAEDLVYSELTTATGEITLFQKTMNYKSQFTGPAEKYIPVET
ncbi:hypothetical protein J2741_000285 [Methanolinea mesophila]|uniref:hypothetical protein n=1 Tax=Methanolinea mesophila TaxID=547055 RepID=UPI001AE3D74B|nr:hypothetical protein [Methanolinea mesophila]MBP1927738.1 hypothetical protein [Methanolinea mesophila]